MAGWGLLTLLGAGLLALKTDFGFGFPAFLVGLSIAAARARDDSMIAVKTLLYLVVTTFFVLGISSGLFWIDYRPPRPVTADLLPAVYQMCNPCPSNVRLTLYFASVWSSVVCAVMVRLAMGRNCIGLATGRAAVVFAVTLAVHMTVVADNKKVDVEMRDAVVSLYSLMPVYAGYFVALFWDVVRAKDSRLGVE